MSAKISRIVFTTLSIILTIAAIYFQGLLDCGAQPISIWITGCLLLLSIGAIFSNFTTILSNYPKLLFWLIATLLPVAILAVLIWCALGTIWLYQNVLYGNKCLSLFISIGVLWGMFVTHVAIIISAFTGFKFIRRLLVEKNNEAAVKRQLRKLYNTKSQNNNVNIGALLEKHKNLIETLPLFEQEHDIIKAHFTTVINYSESDVDCSICLTSFEADEFKTSFGCTHSYHFSCIVEWLSMKPSCPCCRQAFRPVMLKSYSDKVLSDIHVKDKCTEY